MAGLTAQPMAQRSVYLTSKEAFADCLPPSAPPGSVGFQASTATVPISAPPAQGPLSPDLFVTATANVPPSATQRPQYLSRPATFQSTAKAAASAANAISRPWTGGAFGAEQGEGFVWVLVTITYLIGSVVALGLAVAYIMLTVRGGGYTTSTDHSEFDLTEFPKNTSMSPDALKPTAVGRLAVASPSYDFRTTSSPAHAAEMLSSREDLDA